MAVYEVDGKAPQVDSTAWIADSAQVMGNVTLGPDASVWFGCVLRGDTESMTIGEGSNIQDLTVMHADVGMPLSVGKHVTVGHKVVLHGCTIGSRVLIGIGAIVMDGVVIEDEVVLGAGSLVPPGKKLESGFLYVGSPAKQVRALTEREKAFFTYSANNYRKLKDQYLDETVSK